MSENLYENTMAYSGQEVPWHRKGIQFAEPMTSQQVIQAAKLNYLVEKEPAYRLKEDEFGVKTPIKIGGAFVTINRDNDKVLGVVGSRYEPIQNIDAFDFFDEFIGADKAIFETGGALGDGEKMWLLAKLPNEFAPVAGDLIKQYCVLYNTHDGSSPCSVMFTPIRVVCQNTMNMALRKCTNIVKIRHTINASDRLAEAGRILSLMNEYFTRMGEECTSLAKTPIDDKFIEEYQDALFGKEKDFADRGPGRSIRLKKIEMFRGRLHNGMGVDIPGVAGSAWHPLQAAIEFADYDMPKEGRDMAESVVFGTAAEFKQKAWDKMFELVKVA